MVGYLKLVGLAQLDQVIQEEGRMSEEDILITESMEDEEPVRPVDMGGWMGLYQLLTYRYSLSWKL